MLSLLHVTAKRHWQLRSSSPALDAPTDRLFLSTPPGCRTNYTFQANISCFCRSQQKTPLPQRKDPLCQVPVRPAFS